MPFSPAFHPSSDYTRLGGRFYDPVRPAAFPEHILRYRNQKAAATVGLDTLTDEEWVRYFGEFQPLPGSLEQPLALRYHGHQFGHYNPDLGDGRGFLFAQLRAQDGRLLDLGTKGSGRTPWSRGGDGRLTLQGGVREVLAATMLEALGVCTSRAFSLIETGEKLERHDEPSPARSAVLVRLSHTHIRIGTFQRLAALGDTGAISALVRYVLETCFPDAPAEEGEPPALTLFRIVSRRIARMGAQWMAAGFVHGVLNTDNISVTGESFDYGPWRFAPVFDPEFVAAYFDHEGRYAYGRQPDALFRGLARFAECLLELVPEEALREAFGAFPDLYRHELDQAWCRRLGVVSAGAEADRELRITVTDFMEKSRIPFPYVPFDWYGGAVSTERAMRSARSGYYLDPGFSRARELLESRMPAESTATQHVYFSYDVPCDMHIGTVETIRSAISSRNDWSVFENALVQAGIMSDALKSGFQPAD